MKILLIVPTYKYKTHYPSYLSVSDFPSGFAYIASSLEQAGHEVYGLNLNNIIGYQTAYDMIRDNIIYALEEVKPDLVATGGICIDYKFLKDAIQIIRDNSKVPIVLGGGIVTNDAEFVFETLKPDYAIVGEGEDGMVRLANGETDEKIIRSRALDVNSLPFPDWDCFGIKNMVDNFSDVTRVLYRYSRTYPKPFIIVTARGCPFHCNFCKKHPEGYRPRSIENIMAEIAVNYEKYKFNILIIQDELFAVNKKRMVEFCNTLIENKKTFGWDFDWMMQTHANAKLDLDTLKLAKEAGMYLFSYGLESFSPVVLRSMNKKTKPGQVVEAIKLADEAKVGFAGNILFGDPAETEDTVRETMMYYFQYGIDPAVFLTLVSPYPGSDIFDYCLEKGIITDKLDYYEHIDEHTYNMTQMPNHLFIEWGRLLLTIENSYMLIKATNADKILKVGGWSESIHLWEVYARCPHCGEDCVYTQLMSDAQFGQFLVPSCQHCHKRMRVNVPMELKHDN